MGECPLGPRGAGLGGGYTSGVGLGGWAIIGEKGKGGRAFMFDGWTGLYV
jgi:hypothetical protein